MSRPQPCILATLLCLTLACASATVRHSSKVAATLSIDCKKYSPGDTVIVVLQNVGTVDVGHNMCNRTLQLRERREWRDAETWPPPPGICDLPIYNLRPGKTVVIRAALAYSLKPGLYRLVFKGAPIDLKYSAEFSVRAH